MNISRHLSTTWSSKCTVFCLFCYEKDSPITTKKIDAIYLFNSVFVFLYFVESCNRSERRQKKSNQYFRSCATILTNKRLLRRKKRLSRRVCCCYCFYNNSFCCCQHHLQLHVQTHKSIITVNSVGTQTLTRLLVDPYTGARVNRRLYEP